MNIQQKGDALLELRSFMYETFKARKGVAMRRARHHKIICDALEQVVLGRIKRLIINLPPRAGKTEALINFVAWAMGHYPDSEFIYTSYSRRLAVHATYQIRALMQEPIYRELFPWTQLRDDSTAREEFRTTRSGIVYGTGIEGTITGYGFGKVREGFAGALIIDDPTKSDEANSKIVREHVIDWFQNTAETRRNNPDAPIILLAQRLHPNDLPGWLLAGGNGEKWTQIVIPALDEDDKSFWEYKYPAEELIRLRTTNRFWFAAQYQQCPIVQGGNLIKSAWFKRYKQLPPLLDWRSVFGDTAQKTSERNDFTVFESWGTKAGSIYLLDLLRGRWEAPDLKRRAKDFWNKQSAGDSVALGALRRLYVEDKSSGTGLLQELGAETGIPIKGIERSKDKYSRWCDVAGYVESGRVWIPDDAPWVNDFIGECEAFTSDDSHDYDDQIDPMIDAITAMLTPANTVDQFLKAYG